MICYSTVSNRFAIACVVSAVCVGGILIARAPFLRADRRQPPSTSADAAEQKRAKEVAALAPAASKDDLPPITVDYPLAGAVFPPEIVPPTVLWHEPTDAVNRWLIEVTFPATERRIHALSDGRRPEPVIDPKTVAENNAWEEDEYQATAKAWTPDRETWELMKRCSTERDLTLTVWGLTANSTDLSAPSMSIRRLGETPRSTGDALSGDGRANRLGEPEPGLAPFRLPPDDRVVSRGSVRFRTSADPVGAPIFYRDVPLMPSETKDGIVKPLADTAISLIKWRLRDISKPSAPSVMQHMPTCANCHSFSADGRTLAMDVDGPSGDKGAHTVQDVAKRMVIEDEEVFSWNNFAPDPAVMSFGLFPRVSPDGRYVAATVKESVFVQNYADFRFLQTFYPTRGIIAVYDRETGKMAALPGADDPQYVQTNPVWTPDGKSIVFLRALARDSVSVHEHGSRNQQWLAGRADLERARIGL